MSERTIEEKRASVELTDVVAGYGPYAALHGISMQVGEGKFVGLIGPNGAGKTTLLRVISGALPVMQGGVHISGKNIQEYRRREIARIMAFVPQMLEVPVAYTAFECVAMGRTPYLAGWSGMSRKDMEIVRRAMDMTDAVHLKDRFVGELSAGERQRILIAMALAQEPQIILMDEPLAHLDIQHVRQLVEIMQKLNRDQGMSIVMSSHDLNLAFECCSDLLLLNEGSMVKMGASLEVMNADLLSKVYKYPLEVLRLEGRDRLWVVPAEKS